MLTHLIEYTNVVDGHMHSTVRQKQHMIEDDYVAEKENNWLVVCITKQCVVKCEKVTKIAKTEMPFNIVLLINDAAAERLLVSLSL